MKSPIKIVRALWGEPSYLKKEVTHPPLFDNEIVFVWGIDNYTVLVSMGYECILVSEFKYNMEYSHYYKHFIHKLFALDIACTLYDEFLFLDWDVSIVKDIDDIFWNKIRTGNSIQCPIYSYHEEDKYGFFNRFNPNTILFKFIDKLFNTLETQSWKFGDYSCIPNFCFLYVRNNKKLGKKLIDITLSENIITCIEEFALYKYVNCDMDTYIEKYEPIVISGHDKPLYIKNISTSELTINEYVNTKIGKDIYLIHEQ